MIKSAGIVPVRKVGDQYLFLMLRAFSYWDFPKGKSEEHETLLEAAIRETEEESTLTLGDLDFTWGMDSYTTEPYAKNKKTATYFIAETAKEKISLPVNLELGKPEHQEYKWLTYDQAISMCNNRIKKVVEWARIKCLK